MIDCGEATISNNTEQNHLNQIKQIIKSHSEEIKHIQEILTNIADIYQEYITISKEFSKQLEKLAMKLKPDGKTFEGKLIQTFQSLLLFNSNSLNEMTEEMDVQIKEENKKGEENKEGLETFKHFNEVYVGQYNKTLDSYKIYETSIESYEKYLVNNELGLENKKNNLSDNHKTVFMNQQMFVNNVRACNDILKSLFDYFSTTKNDMRMKISNRCHGFNDNIIAYLKKQNDICQNQKSLFDNVKMDNNIFELEKKELKKYFLKPNPYSLQCLKKSDEKEEKSEKNEKKLSIKQVLNILQIFRNNKLLLNEQDKSKEKEENNKQEIKDIVDMVFNNSTLYEDSHKQKLISLLDEKMYQLHFLKLLNKYRTNGIFVLKKSAVKQLGYLFQYLNELIIKNMDANIIRLYFIMSFTFYYQDKENYKNVYLSKYIENNLALKDKKFWDNFLDGLITIDTESSDKNDREKEKEENGLEENYIVFTNIISIIKSMANLHLGKEFIYEYLDDITKSKYNLTEDQKLQLNNIIIDSESSSLNENEASTFSSEINELFQNQSINNSIDTNDRSTSRISRISNFFINDNRTSSLSININEFARISNNSNIIIDLNLNNPKSNNSKTNNDNNKMNTESKNESIESIEIE